MFGLFKKQGSRTGQKHAEQTEAEATGLAQTRCSAASAPAAPEGSLAREAPHMGQQAPQAPSLSQHRVLAEAGPVTVRAS